MQISELRPLLPEIMVASLGLVLLIVEAFVKRKEVVAVLALLGAFAAFLSLKFSSFGVLFNGMFILDGYSFFFKVIFFVNLILSVLISVRYLKTEDSFRGEYYCLLVFSTCGMMIMASAGNLITLYLGLELMALSTYVLAGFIRHDTKSTEAAVKYFLTGGFSTALLLYGISLIYGVTGSMDLKTIAVYIAGHDVTGNPMAAIALVLIVSAFAFKIAAVPFHMWAPDVYEGAPTPVTAFMSIGPKAAGFAVLGRVFLYAFAQLSVEWSSMLIALSILTMCVGNVMALVQTNIKRMLAYSSVAHAGYALIGIIAGQPEGLSATMNYLLIYTFMNIGAFTVVLLLNTKDFKVLQISDFAGLGRTHPIVGGTMLIFMFSLTGIPPMAGFIGKFYVFMSAVKSGYLWLTILAVIFSVISAFFYLRIVMYMYMKESERPGTELVHSNTLSVSLAVSAVFVLMIGVMPGRFLEFARAAVERILP
ncbi:NADH-quinone oxidoreductase subunit N [Candidatus Magnetominusculus xianensis]|uniref:NADH-quinone oxidoreductase subunit N n=1 Tax=Candidatus Magnetominusculus xianensis TaxID=1748249 RepID=A0ABR5SI87_9BACT|nr:NADH-quinone oxidoreductase subunit N [Candidatus Magnetominusculus xianensis]KWT92047.1 NADH-quinone oxidoreductase subunit N [Candidatus Magnetominusculus xianensis]MBF0404627.1 NADH-quinone oxidoreductase subunit N [Nitrospirota bacterium]